MVCYTNVSMKLFERRAPWYVAGLAFECTGCGSCCAGPGEGYVWVTKEEIAAIAKHLGISQAEMRRKYVRRVRTRFSLIERADNKDCIFLEADDQGNRKCRIYPVRPRQCRTWPFWGCNLAHPDDWAEAGLRCPGINRGKIHSYDEIETRRKTTPSW